MSAERQERKLAAILAADVVGYSRLMERDEAGTLARLQALRAELIDPLIASHRGRIVKLMGDGALVDFASVVDAVECAIAVQRGVAERNADVPEDQRIEFRVGINSGDVILEGDDIYGDGVNVAARLEGLAEPGGILISGTAHDEIEGKLDYGFELLGEQKVKNLGEQKVKNLERLVRAYRVLPDGAAASMPPSKRSGLRRLWYAGAFAGVAAIVVLAVIGWLRPWQPDTETIKQELDLPDKPSIAVLPFDNLSGDPEQEYFSDGITEDLITDLSKIPHLSVVARHAVLPYKGKSVSPQEVSQNLGVRFILEGRVRRAGESLRINAQLIDATTGYHLWAERYDRQFGDVFAIQDEITEHVVTALRLEIAEDTDQSRSLGRHPNPEAYDAFLRGRTYWRRETKEGIELPSRPPMA